MAIMCLLCLPVQEAVEHGAGHGCRTQVLMTQLTRQSVDHEYTFPRVS